MLWFTSWFFVFLAWIAVFSYLQFRRHFFFVWQNCLNFYPYGKTWFRIFFIDFLVSLYFCLSCMSHRFFLKNLYDFSYSVFNEHSLNFRQGHLAFTKLLRYLNLFKYLRRSVISPKELFSFFLGSSGLEPPTSRLSGARSNLLSYEPITVDGDDGIRTHDPLLAGQVLSQLSYTPIWFRGSFLFQWAYPSLKIEQQSLYALYSYQMTFV